MQTRLPQQVPMPFFYVMLAHLWLGGVNLSGLSHGLIERVKEAARGLVAAGVVKSTTRDLSGGGK
jgi:hypothetical protein